MSKIKIYKEEKRLGLEEQIIAKSSITLACSLNRKSDNTPTVLLPRSLANVADTDLYPIESIMVSTGWNLNDEFFIKSEVYEAKDTPVDKPLNTNHDAGDIIGHITDSWVVDAEGNILPADKIDTIDLFDIKSTAVIYKLQKTEQEDRIRELIEQIENGEWAVSMECYFTDFDYAFQNPKTKKTEIQKRNRYTASLSQYLRAFGGSGVYNGQRIGRALRNITFCGKGLVKNPANPRSIITSVASETTTENEMELDKELEAAKASNVTLSEQLAVANAKIVELTELTKRETDTFKGQLTLAQDANVSLQEKITELNAKLAEANEAFAALTAQKDSLSQELAAIKLEQVQAARLAILVEAGYSEEKAREAVNLFTKLSDDEFNTLASVFKIEKTVEKPVVEDKVVDIESATVETDETVVHATSQEHKDFSKELQQFLNGE